MKKQLKKHINNKNNKARLYNQECSGTGVSNGTCNPPSGSGFMCNLGNKLIKC